MHTHIEILILARGQLLERNEHAKISNSQRLSSDRGHVTGIDLDVVNERLCALSYKWSHDKAKGCVRKFQLVARFGLNPKLRWADAIIAESALAVSSSIAGQAGAWMAEP